MVDEVNMNDANTLSSSTFDMKEEQCQEDSFIEDKVCISETAITVNNAELEGPIQYGKIKRYEESACWVNIKTELPSFEVTEVQNDNVKIEGGISGDNIKIKFDNGLLYCEHCGAYYQDYCINCGMLVNILNQYVSNNANSGARDDIPNDILEIQDCSGQIGIYALRIIPEGVKFGPITGLGTTECPWVMKGEKFVLDQNKSKYLNWMRYINPTRNTSEQNLHVFQSEDNTYYQSTRSIQAGEELLVYLGEEYRNCWNNMVGVDCDATTKDIVKDVFGCTFCCLGFSSKSYLAKHKTVCVENAAGKFSVEELTQCPFCKIHLDLKEYLEHHMASCYKRNVRKCVLRTPPTKQATTALNDSKRCVPQIYKCKQCKYWTKYQTDLEKHTKQHSRVKMYKCGICNSCFKTIESQRFHVENTHIYVGGKDYQEYLTNVYRNTHTKTEQSSLQDQKKELKCSLCVFRSSNKESVRLHMKTKHLKKVDYKCHSCKYGTSKKSNLEIHIKSRHPKQYDYKCDSCKYKTYLKNNLERHINTKHLRKFDYKCDCCEYGTNNKRYLVIHIKAKHLNEYDYKCDSCKYRTTGKRNLERHINNKHMVELECHFCEYRTNGESNLEMHMKTRHLKEFDYKCDSCKYRTYLKNNLERHINTKHLMESNYKCDSCKYRTNGKSNLEMHIKTRHLKKFDYKCYSCEYGTNQKINLEIHIKEKHLKLFDYKCDFCEYKTNNKSNFEIHIKSKHMKEFDYKCDSCEYRTNRKSCLEIHIKARHLKQFDYKCDTCIYKTNLKSNLEIHMNTKHMKKCNYKCDFCDYGTNNKNNLKIHIKSRHL